MAGDLVIRFLGDAREFNAKLAETQAKLGEFAGKTKTTGKTIQDAMGIAAVAGVAALGVAAFDLAQKFDVVHERLITATQDVGENFDEFQGKVDAADKKLEGFGFSATDTEGSLAALTTATKDVGKATQLMGLAADIARGRHIDLASATNILVKVETGHVGLLGRLGLATKDATGKTISQQEAIQRLSQLYGGQASAYTQTFAGKVDVLKARLTDAGIAIGEKLIPVVNDLLGVVSKGISGFDSFNASTDGWAGKLLLVATTAPFAVAGVSKLIGLATSGAGAIKAFAEDLYLWALIHPQLATGLGLAAAAVGTFIGALYLLHGPQRQAAQDASDLADAVEKQNLTLGEAAAQQITDFIEKHKDVQATMEGERISVADLTDAIQNKQSPAYADVKKKVEDLLNGYDNLDGSSRDLSEGAKKLYDELLNESSGFKQAKERVDVHNQAVQALNKSTLDGTKALGGLNGTAQQNTQLTAQQTQAAKEYATALGDLRTVSDSSAVALAKNMHLSTDAIKTLVETVKQVDSSFTDQFDRAASALDDFRDKSHVDFQSFIDDEFKHLVATENWSKNIAQLAKDGIDKGFLKTLIDAGPASAGVVQSILDNTSKGSIGTVNAIAKAASDAKALTLGTLNDFETGVTAFGQFLASQHPTITITVQGQTKNFGGGTIGGGGVRTFAEGGWVDAPAGQAVPAIVHGGEFVLSRDMLRGTKSIPSIASTSGANVNVTVNVYNPTGNGEEIVYSAARALSKGQGRTAMLKALGLK